MNESTPTPRTDEEVRRLIEEHGDFWLNMFHPDFARTLERENVQLREEKVSAIRDRSSSLMHIKDLAKECDDLKAEVERLKQHKESANAAFRQLIGAQEPFDVTNLPTESLLEQRNQISLLEKQVLEMREALSKCRWTSTMEEINQIRDDAISSTPSSISAKWIKREVLEQLLSDYRTDGCADPDCFLCKKSKAAEALARAELGKA